MRSKQDWGKGKKAAAQNRGKLLSAGHGQAVALWCKGPSPDLPCHVKPRQASPEHNALLRSRCHQGAATTTTTTTTSTFSDNSRVPQVDNFLYLKL